MAENTNGLYATLFVRSARQGDTVRTVVNSLREMMGAQAENDRDRPIVFAAEVAGAYRAVVVVEVAPGDLQGLHDFLGGEEYEGISFDWDRVEFELVVEGPPFIDAVGRLYAPKRPPGCDVLAFVRINVEPGRTREVLGRLGDELGPVFHGAAIVFGGADILLTLDGPDFESVARAALASLQGIQGITGTETSFADVRRYHVEA